jgi:hypothetical protein
MLLGEDMLNVVRQFAVILPQPAILTTVVGPLPHQSAPGGVHR